MARYIAYGGTILPLGFMPYSDALSRDIQPLKLPRTDGARVIAGYSGEKVVPVRGTLIKGPVSTLRDGHATLRQTLDALREQLANQPQNLYFFDDRYYRDVYTRGVSVSYDRLETIAHVEIEFVTGDPFQYGIVEHTDFWSGPTNGSSRVITPGGNAYTMPTYKIDCGSTGTLTCILSNNTAVKSFTLSGSVTAGQVIEIDTRAKTVVIGATDKMSLFSGQFPELLYTANTYQFTVTSGSVASISTVYRYRWWG